MIEKRAVKQGHTKEYQNSFRKKKTKQQIPIMKEAKHNRKTATLLIHKLNISEVLYSLDATETQGTRM